MNTVDVMRMVMEIMEGTTRVPVKLFCAPNVLRSILPPRSDRLAAAPLLGVEVIEVSEMAPGAWIMVDREGRPVAKGQGAMP